MALSTRGGIVWRCVIPFNWGDMIWSLFVIVMSYYVCSARTTESWEAICLVRVCKLNFWKLAFILWYSQCRLLSTCVKVPVLWISQFSTLFIIHFIWYAIPSILGEIESCDGSRFPFTHWFIQNSRRRLPSIAHATLSLAGIGPHKSYALN